MSNCVVGSVNNKTLLRITREKRQLTKSPEFPDPFCAPNTTRALYLDHKRSCLQNYYDMGITTNT